MPGASHPWRWPRSPGRGCEQHTHTAGGPGQRGSATGGGGRQIPALIPPPLWDTPQTPPPFFSVPLDLFSAEKWLGAGRRLRVASPPQSPGSRSPVGGWVTGDNGSAVVSGVGWGRAFVLYHHASFTAEGLRPGEVEGLAQGHAARRRKSRFRPGQMSLLREGFSTSRE